MSERCGLITETDTSDFLRALARIGATVDDAPDDAAVLALGRRHRLRVYDAGYLELARRENLTLGTLDTELLRAARAEHQPLLGEAAA